MPAAPTVRRIERAVIDTGDIEQRLKQLTVQLVCDVERVTQGAVDNIKQAVGAERDEATEPQAPSPDRPGAGRSVAHAMTHMIRRAPYYLV